MTVPVDRRAGLSGELANELASVLTAVVILADEIADGPLADSWNTQLQLGALERALTRSLGLVRGLSNAVRTEPIARMSLEDLALPRPQD